MNKLLEKRCLIWNRCGSSFADGQRLMFLLFDSLFTCSPSDNCSDKEDFAAMWGLHEYLVWTSGNSWLNHSSSCFSSWTLFLPVEVSTVKAIFLHSDIHILNLFLRWSMLNGKLPSSYFWSNSLSTSACISAFFKFFVYVKINFYTLLHIASKLLTHRFSHMLLRHFLFSLHELHTSLCSLTPVLDSFESVSLSLSGE